MVARRVPRKEAKKAVLRPLRGQPTLLTLMKQETPPVVSSEDEESVAEIEPTKGTRGFKRYNIRFETTLVFFRHHLI